jgi:hypothetical protein
VASSSVESETIAMSGLVKEMRRIQLVLKDKIFCENTTTIAAIENRGYNKKSKHIDARGMFVKEFPNRKIFRVEYIPLS